MQISIVCLFLFLCGFQGILSLHECGEFNQRGVLSGVTKTDPESMLLENVLGDFFNALNSNDTQRMSQIYNFMENLTKGKEERSFSSNNLLKFVVRFWIRGN